MNLHQLAAGGIGMVNPFETVQYARSIGYTTGAAGKRTPTYAQAVPLVAQVQQLTQRDLQKLAALNIQGDQRKLYCNGSAAGVVRQSGGGGDLITLADGSNWLVTMQLEQWRDWVSVAMVRQNP